MLDTSQQRHRLGLPDMDAQHDYLYMLFDAIEQSLTVTDKPGMRLLLDEIERYVNFHFQSEELLMRLYKYPGFAVHQSDHEQAAAKFVSFMDDFDANGLNPAALRIFLTGWLMEHSQMCDSGYTAWISQQRENITKILTIHC
jgi:hemerythrin